MQAIAFDKTGTLTVGRPVLIKVHSVGWSNEETLLAVAGSLESHSTHPIAEAIFAAAVERKLTLPELVDVRYVTGRGIEGTLAGKPARLGSLVFVESLIPECLRQRVNDVLVTVQSKGHIAVCMAHDEMAAVLILSDRVRAGAAELVGQLHALGIKPVVMLTGDNQRTADTVASQLGLDAFFAQLMPGDKVEHVKRLKSGEQGGAQGAPGEFGKIGKLGERRKVGVIGDGVNDAPALAAADVAIAIGSIGSDAAMESADIVLLNDDLRAVPWAISLARRTRRTIIINLVFALSAIAVMTVAVLIGRANGYTVPLWMGVVGHEGGTLLVVAHSLWLLRFGQLKLEGATHQPGLPSGTHPPGSAEIRQAHAASAERRELDVSLSPG